MAIHVNIINTAYKDCRTHFLLPFSGADWIAVECFPCNSASQCPDRSGLLPPERCRRARWNSCTWERGRTPLQAKEFWPPWTAEDGDEAPRGIRPGAPPHPLHHPYPRTCHAVKRRDGGEKQEVRVITTLYETPGSITVIYEIVRVFTAAAEFYDSIRDFEELLNTDGSTSTSLCEMPRGSSDNAGSSGFWVSLGLHGITSPIFAFNLSNSTRK